MSGKKSTQKDVTESLKHLSYHQKWRKHVLDTLSSKDFQNADIIKLELDTSLDEYFTPAGVYLNQMRSRPYLHQFFEIDEYEHLVKPLKKEVGAIIMKENWKPVVKIRYVKP